MTGNDHKELGALEQDRTGGFFLSGDLVVKENSWQKVSRGLMRLRLLCVFVLRRLRIHVLRAIGFRGPAGSRTGTHSARFVSTNGLIPLTCFRRGNLLRSSAPVVYFSFFGSIVSSTLLQSCVRTRI